MRKACVMILLLCTASAFGQFHAFVIIHPTAGAIYAVPGEYVDGVISTGLSILTMSGKPDTMFMTEWRFAVQYGFWEIYTGGISLGVSFKKSDGYWSISAPIINAEVAPGALYSAWLWEAPSLELQYMKGSDGLYFGIKTGLSIIDGELVVPFSLFAAFGG